jgi:hypothetical protein
MADGTSKPIAEIEIGDKVKATDPTTGDTTDRDVVATIVHDDEDDMTRLTVESEDGSTGTVDATSWHPVWVDAEGRFVNIGDLKPGQQLTSSDESSAEVASVRKHARLEPVYDLTIAGVHTYYVLAGATPVLVHNCGTGGEAPRTADGKYAERDGEPGRDGAGHERAVWDLLEGEGFDVIRGEVRVQGGWSGGVRIYDGAIQTPNGLIGIEAKTDGRVRTGQRIKDAWINTPGNTGEVVGRNNRGASVIGTVVVQVFR